MGRVMMLRGKLFCGKIHNRINTNSTEIYDYNIKNLFHILNKIILFNQSF